MLTQKQTELLKFLEKCKQTPSFDEMKDALGLQSKSGIHRLITALEERGYIRRLPNRARALEVLRSASEKVSQTVQSSAFSIPLYGKIAAGAPIEAHGGTGQMIEIPPSMIGKGQYYALTVAGDSMIEDGIFDGDLAIIRETKLADNGATVVALVDDEDATLKRFFKDGRNIRLEPANKDYKAQIYPSARVQVQGQLAGLIRRY